MTLDIQVQRKLRLAWVLMLLFYFCGAALLVYLAGTFDLPFFWGILCIHLCTSAIALSVLDPALLAERLKPAGKDEDPSCVPLLCTFYPLQYVLAVLDPYRLHWLQGSRLPLFETVPFWLRVLAMVGVVLGWGLFLWSMKTNFFFSSAIRLQPDRGQTVIDSGPYAWVRHPGYSGAVLMFLAEALAMGSWLSVGMAVLSILVLVRRTLLEEKMLRQGLPGYVEYSSRVRYRWFPFLF